MKRLQVLALIGATALPFWPQDSGAHKDTMAAKVGAPAPQIRLNNTDGVPVQVSTPDRWSVLAFFPKAATPG